MSLADKWIIGKLNNLVVSTNQHFTNYKFGEMVMGLYDFWKKELADVYLEAIKPVMKSGKDNQKQAALNCLYLCLDIALKMLHPTMPYITEELYQRLPHLTKSDSICISQFPQPQQLRFDSGKVEEHMNKLMNTVRALRQQIAAYNVQGKVSPTIVVQTSNADLLAVLKTEVEVVQSLVKAGETLIISGTESPPEGCLKGFVSDEISIYVKVVGLINMKTETGRIEKRMKELEQLKGKLAEKMERPDYNKKTPEKVRAQD